MSRQPYLSLTAAIFININIMLGSGIFINSVTLAKGAGVLGALVYPLVGLLLLPLILVFSSLLAQKPGGSFFEFGAILHPVAGFLSSWGYFVGKLASAALSLHIFVTLMGAINPWFGSINPLVADGLILAIFVFLTLFNVKTGKPIQYGFFSMKVVAITTAFVASARLWDISHFVGQPLNWSGIPSSVAFGLFAFAGFEATCSLSKNIRDPEKNGPRAVFLSYLAVLAVITLYQVLLYGALGPSLGSFASNNFQEPLGLVVHHAFGGSVAAIVQMVMFICIAASALGASYGILYSNLWNLHTLAQFNAVPFSHALSRCNRYYAPMWCVLIAGFIEFCYVLISKGAIILLQQITTCASTLAYLISAIGFCVLAFSANNRLHKLYAILGIGSALLFVAFAVSNAVDYGVSGYLLYASLLLAGLFGFWYAQKKSANTLPA